jgi:hypothetical protein
MPKKTGRPKKEIDFQIVEDLAKIFCTQEEIAGILHVSVDTLQRSEKFCGIYKTAQETAKSSLRRAQWAMVEKGNTGMAIWLGKQYLGQKDKTDHEITGKDGAPIKTETTLNVSEEVKKYARLLANVAVPQ